MSSRVQKLATENDQGVISAEIEQPHKNSKVEPSLNSVMSDLTRLSKSFVNTYQDLEGQVEELNGQLEDVHNERSEAIEEKLKLLDEKQMLANRLQNLLAILPSGVVVLDGQGKVKDCNAVAVDLLGRPLLGESWLNVIQRAFMPQADDGHQISLKDGRKIHIETRALDSEPGQMIVLTDMTKTRQLQAQLSHQQKLSSMGKMLASLAHQIRTPLSAAILYSSHLNTGNLSEKRQNEFSQSLFERLKFMDRQINDMLNFVKGERKQKDLSKIQQLLNMIQQACVSFDHHIQFNIDPKLSLDKLILIDQDSLVGAITNLIENSIHATSDQSPIFVKFSAQKDTLQIQVVDCGNGIESINKDKIFEPFYTTKNNGNGLGLAVVKGIVIDHGGNITVQTKLGKGSCFSIQLPLSQEKRIMDSTLLTSFENIENNQEHLYGR